MNPFDVPVERVIIDGEDYAVKDGVLEVEIDMQDYGGGIRDPKSTVRIKGEAIKINGCVE